jgi:hypothetical protein
MLLEVLLLMSCKAVMPRHGLFIELPLDGDCSVGHLYLSMVAASASQGASRSSLNCHKETSETACKDQSTLNPPHRTLATFRARLEPVLPVSRPGRATKVAVRSYSYMIRG